MVSDSKRRRCRGTIVQRDRLTRFGQVNEHKAAAAQVTRPRQCHREGEANRNGGIDGVTAAGENLLANFCCDRVL